jgi:hypothetical protein
MIRLSLFVGILALLAFHCSSQKSLTDSERSKLDPPLIRLLTGENLKEDQVKSALRKDGTKEYSVIVRTEKPTDLTDLGINVSSVFGDVIVAHVTIEELRKIISLSSVRAVEAGSKNIIQ